jgi:hypothetical protein
MIKTFITGLAFTIIAATTALALPAGAERALDNFRNNQARGVYQDYDLIVDYENWINRWTRSGPAPMPRDLGKRLAESWNYYNDESWRYDTIDSSGIRTRSFGGNNWD